MKNFSLIIVLSLLLMASCKKDVTVITNPPIPVQGIDLTVSYKVDNTVLQANTMIYKTLAGYDYSVTTLNYYISQLSLIKADSSCILLKDYQYINALVPANNQMILKDIPAGNYIGMKFNIGLDPLHNKSDALPVTNENINMQWPDAMGGGYHMLRLEGYYKDISGTYGYAMHLGTDSCLVPIKIYKPVTIIKNTKTPVHLVMNINEWFQNPYKYDFNIDGNYIMGNMQAMKKISGNGMDVFNF